MQTSNVELDAALQFGADPSLTSHPAWDKISWAVNILRDMAAKRVRYKTLSVKQQAFAIKLHKDSLQRMSWADQRIAERAKRIADGIRAPKGRLRVTGVLKSQKQAFSAYGETTKCLIELTNGAKVWGTKPSAADTENGKLVTFVATFEPSEDDPSFGFYSRPANWQEAA